MLDFNVDKINGYADAIKNKVPRKNASEDYNEWYAIGLEKVIAGLTRNRLVSPEIPTLSEVVH